VIRESYADNLKDQNDDTLRKIAQRVLDRLGGTAVGTIVVRMGSENGEIVVDGDKHVPLQNGTARLELAPGGHSVEVAVTGQAVQKRNVLVTAGKETVVDLALANSGAATDPPKSDKPFPTRKVVGGGLATLGAGAGVVALISGLAYLKAVDEGDELNRTTTNPQEKLPENQSPDQACGKDLSSSAPICKKNDEASSSSTVFWISASATGVLLLAGAYFLFTDGGSTEKEKAAALKKTRIAPTVGHGSGGFVLSGSF
jgi:hypothetical protein